MPKQKSKRAARKRFKIAASGKIRRWRAYKSHILTKKTQKRKRHLRKAGIVSKGDHRRTLRTLQA